MPSRKKKIKPPPNFSFVTIEYKQNQTSWRQVYSGAARSQAAYWGGTGKHEERTKRDDGVQQGAVKPKPSNEHESCFPDIGEQHIRRKNTRSIIVRHNAGAQIPRHMEPDNLQYLPSITTRARSPGSTFATDLTTFEFCGEGFMKRFVLLDHPDSPIMFDACVLLSYAHAMALTGHGSKKILFELKGQVMQRLTASMNSSGGFLNPRALIAVLALGSPVVSLTSQDVPYGLPMWEFIHTTANPSSFCCRPDSADNAKKGHGEQLVHRQAMYKFLLSAKQESEDVEGLELIKYVSNCANISMALDASNYDSSSNGIGRLMQAAAPSGSCSIPAEWTSPLTCDWVDRHAGSNTETYFESQMLLLASLTHKWFRTFVDEDSREPSPTPELLQERASLRQQIELFPPAAKDSHYEPEAMYECCRWASGLLLAVQRLGLPIKIAKDHSWIQPRLSKRLRMTDLPSLWGRHRGLLFWIISSCHFVTWGTCFPLLMTTMLAKFTQQIAMTDDWHDIAVVPLRRLKLFESICCRDGESGGGEVEKV
ncbi:hypothetical protein BT63DRAFT_135270 [Microthyrium microscopicum]|uniref:Transcription factor domain-containing protein n=1 Tax=Microthyrium microscopicum TaxID=703497 RepID=A0A6A6ULT1_9PEZI|nr:hypothetical protein BT63DRAFT_135270 [Microthyrium microscopicum]